MIASRYAVLKSPERIFLVNEDGKGGRCLDRVASIGLYMRPQSLFRHGGLSRGAFEDQSTASQ
jgi:hypothetical protein